MWALRSWYELRDTTDPILLDDIDESIEWLARGESENVYVSDEEDCLTYRDIYNSCGVR